MGSVKKDNLTLAISYFERFLDKPFEQAEANPIFGWKLVEILWPLNDIFRPNIEQIKTIKYREKFEKRADRAIEKFAYNPHPKTWSGLEPGTWRVLLERHQQLIAVALANELEGNPVTILPSGLPLNSQLGGVMLLLLHSMTLPGPAGDQSHLELPDGESPASLTRH